MTTGRVIPYKGAYGYVISTPRDPVSGKYKQIWRVGFKSQKEAREKLRMHLNELTDESTPIDMTVSEWLHRWLNEGRNDYKPLTIKSHEHCVNHYIAPRLGKIKLDKLSHADIQRLYTHHLKTLSPVTVNRIHRTLRAALNKAVKQGIIKDSPMERVDPPSGKSPKRSTLSVKDALNMLEWLKHHGYIAYYGAYLAVYGGLRLGEVCGLQWRDIDWETNTIYIRRTRQRLNKQNIITDPKTKDSMRDIVLPDFAMKELREWYEYQLASFVAIGETLKQDGFVIIKPDFTTPETHAFAKGVKTALSALELPIVTFHDLRHTHATWLLESGVDLKTVSQRLGHSSITVTADVYSHVTKRMQKDAMTKLEKMMGLNDEKK